jgi:hypothetical protein
MQSKNKRLFVSDFVSKVANMTVLTNSQKDNYGSKADRQDDYFSADTCDMEFSSSRLAEKKDFFGSLGLIDGGDYWSQTTNMISTRLYGGGFALTSDASLACGGYGESDGYKSEIYLRSGNYWKAARNMVVVGLGVNSFTTIQLGKIGGTSNTRFLVVGGNVISPITIPTSGVIEYVPANDSWVTQEDYALEGRCFMAGSVTSAGRGIITGGEKSNNIKVNSTNRVHIDTDSPYPIVWQQEGNPPLNSPTSGMTGISSSSRPCVSAGVTGSGYSSRTYRYVPSVGIFSPVDDVTIPHKLCTTMNFSDYTSVSVGGIFETSAGSAYSVSVSYNAILPGENNGGIWKIRSFMPTLRVGASSSSASATIGIVFGGEDPTSHEIRNTTYLYRAPLWNQITDSTSLVTTKKDSEFFIDCTYFGTTDSNFAYPADKRAAVETVVLSSATYIPPYMYISSIYDGNNVLVPYISLDDGNTWSDAKGLNTIESTENVTVYQKNGTSRYMLKLKFDMPYTASTFTARSSSAVARHGTGNISLSYNKGIVVGGNTGTACCNMNEKYVVSANIWINSALYPGQYIQNPGNFTFGNSMGYIIGGETLSEVIDDVYSYNEITNAWTSRNNTPVNISKSTSMSADSTTAVILGGITIHEGEATDIMYQYFRDHDTWSSVYTLGRSLKMGIGLSYTNDIVVCAGGTNGTTTSNIINAYSISNKTESAWGRLQFRRMGGAGISLSDSVGIITCGCTSPEYTSVGLIGITEALKRNLKISVPTTASLPRRYDLNCTVNMTSTYGIVSHGYGYPTTSSTGCTALSQAYMFNYGDVQFYGFSCSNILGN